MSSGLGHVRWVGGASGAGKSTLSRLLSETFDLPTYPTDQAIAVHAARPGPDAPLLERFRAMSMDSRQDGPVPQVLCERDEPWSLVTSWTRSRWSCGIRP